MAITLATPTDVGHLVRAARKAQKPVSYTHLDVYKRQV